MTKYSIQEKNKMKVPFIKYISLLFSQTQQPTVSAILIFNKKLTHHHLDELIYSSVFLLQP